MTATIDRPAPPAPVPRPPDRLPTRPLAPTGRVANLSLGLLTLAAVLALSRLFTRPSAFFFPVAAVAATVHLIAWACRRGRLDLAVAAPLAAAGGGLVACWVTLGSTTAYGIPWRGTYHAVGPALQAASDAYRTTAAPTHVIPGFVLAGAFGAGIAAFLSDWAAFRMRATTEACLPSFSLFVLSAALAQGHRVELAAGAWLVALLVFFLVRQPAIDGPATAWFASTARRGPGSIVAVGSGVVAVAVIAAVSLGPHLPGATVHPLFNWRRTGTGGAGRTTGSPLVDISARLHDESQQEVFTVQTASPSYWRITALDSFDGRDWSLNNEYRRTGSDLTTVGTAVPDLYPTRPVEATFRVSNLQSLWLPAPYRPVRISGVSSVSFSPDAASVITDKTTSDGLTYSVVSAVPAVTPAQLEQSPYVSSDDPAFLTYLQLPATTPGEVRQLAVEHTAGAGSPYEAARMLQDWLRSPPFRYSLDVPADDSQNALLNFLTRTRAGFCQQYATAFAVLARSIGLPTRVAVGFTAGVPGNGGVYHVRDQDAHAWPEVYFEGAGWVAFEPTPGRGSPDPGARAITGAPPGQAESGPTSTPSTTTAPSGPTSSVPSPAGRSNLRDRSGATTSAKTRSRSDAPLVVLVGLAVVAGLAAAWALLVWGTVEALTAFRRRRARAPDDRVVLAWTEAEEALARCGAARRPWETPAEFSRRAARSLALPPPAAHALSRLGSSLELAAYAPVSPDEEDATEASGDAEVVASTLEEGLVWQARVGRLFDPRRVWVVGRSVARDLRRVSPGA